MRASIVLAVTLWASACTLNDACKRGTVFVTVTLSNGAEAADFIDVTLAVGSAASQTKMVSHPANSRSETIEVDFGSAYPSGQPLAFLLTARSDGRLLATNSQSITAGPGCSTLLITLDASAGDAGDDAGRADLLPAPDLTPVKQQGDRCIAGVDVCGTGHCVDGYCCNNDCADSCGACDVSGHLGTCSPVTGPSHGSRACNGSGTCGGTCNGSMLSCSYPAASTSCGPACNGNCDGNGACTVSGGGACPNGFACGSGACLSACSVPSDCATNFTCMAPNCVRAAESDCLDGVDNNGDGLIDCDDPTCTTVMCVTAPGSGNEVGFFPSSTCPASNYASEPQRQNLSQPSCTGCSCATSAVTCYTNGTLYYANNDTTCSNGASSVPFKVDHSGSCLDVPTHTYYSFQLGTPTSAGDCTAAGSATLPASSFAVTDTFCGASHFSANNCNHDASKLCVAKPPPSTTLCARVPGGAGGCPPGYTGGGSATYYTGISPGSCGSCGGCTPGTISCQLSTLNTYSADSCSAASNTGITANPSTDCTSTFMPAGSGGGFFGPIGDFSLASLDFGDQSVPDSIMCASPSVTTTPATPNGASIICCQP